MFESCVCCVGSGLCYEPITRAEESYLVCVRIIVCDIETSTASPQRGNCVVQSQLNIYVM
jgi:hypothetical protein